MGNNALEKFPTTLEASTEKRLPLALVEQSLRLNEPSFKNCQEI
jgi:hypothetical protein